ncbi:TniQ family protein [Stenotrophomonas sp. JC08]|uniref:TniQ family protein n=1 Tax=Stenotrophomonas sp. JC08 TaxID=3445779 RepID=UPI003FA2FF9B
MGHLLPLRMLGTGSADVEALPSYLIRLASAHGITTGHLMRLLLANTGNSEVDLAAGIHSQPFAGLVRPNTTTRRVLESATRHVLEPLGTLIQGTFLFLYPAIKRSTYTYSPTIRWCPACLSEQTVIHGAAYLKLSWLLEGAEACAIHRLRLRNTCPHCQRFARPMNRWLAINVCQHCDAPLDRVTADDVVLTVSTAAAPDLVRFVGDLAHRHIPFPIGAANRFIDQIFNEAWASQREQDLWKKLPRDDCLRYANPDEPITLPTARRIAYLLEMPISELLDGGTPTVQSFGFAAEQPLPAPMEPGKRGPKVKVEALGKTLMEALATGAPRSLEQISRDSETTVGAMRYHYPDLVRRLALNWNAHLAAERNRKRAQAREATFNGIQTWHQRQTKPLSRKGLLAELIRETGLPKEVLRQAIQQFWIPALSAALGSEPAKPPTPSRTDCALRK